MHVDHIGQIDHTDLTAERANPIAPRFIERRVVRNGFQTAVVTEAMPAQVSTDAEAQTATFRFAAPLAPGRYQLRIAYSGKIDTQATGRVSSPAHCVSSVDFP